jgi:hypothetical protein
MRAKPFTASWFTQLPATFVRVGISRGVPRRTSGYRMYSKLAPGSYFKSASAGEYRERYMSGLAVLDAETVLAEIHALCDGRTPVLVCFEPQGPDDAWCHRGFVSAWFHDTLGLEVYEYGYESLGCGWSHPKIPSDFRRLDAGAGRAG